MKATLSRRPPHPVSDLPPRAGLREGASRIDVYACLVRLGLWLYRLALVLAPVLSAMLGWWRPARAMADPPCTVLATGTFFSNNWLRAHLLPLVGSPACVRVVVVADHPFIRHERVEYRSPPRWLRRVFGRVGARSLLLLWAALRLRPQHVMGYHLVPNGMLALLAARLVGARAIYQCCGGPGELDGGGPAMQENALLRRVKNPHRAIARQLRIIVRRFDVIVTRGVEASRFFASNGASGTVISIPAGLDSNLYATGDINARDYDLITVGRLADVKRIDVFLRMVELIRAHRPGVRAVVVGDGPLRGKLESYARRRGLNTSVDFVGARNDIISWLRRGKVFVLTSDSEGLSIALAEAMMASLPAVVSRVGDLETLVIHGENGFLVDRGRPEQFAEAALRLLENPGMLLRFAQEARRRALDICASSRVSAQWTSVLRVSGSSC